MAANNELLINDETKRLTSTVLLFVGNDAAKNSIKRLIEIALQYEYNRGKDDGKLEVIKAYTGTK